jgi:hypothetical protein
MKAAHDLLISLGADKIPHSGRTLYEHLCNTESILKICRCDETVSTAGLIHSIYGTDFFKTATTNDRDLVCSIVGKEIEHIAWIFCNAMRPFCWFTGSHIPFRDGTHISVDTYTLKALQMIEGANLLDQQMGFEILISMGSQNAK